MSVREDGFLVETSHLGSPLNHLELLDGTTDRCTWFAKPYTGLGSNSLRSAMRAKRQWAYTELKGPEWNHPEPSAEISLLGKPDAPFSPIGGADRTYLQRVIAENDSETTRLSLSFKVTRAGYLEAVYCLGHPSLYQIARRQAQQVYVTGEYAAWSRIFTQVDVYSHATETWKTLLSRTEVDGSAKIPVSGQLMRNDTLRVFIEVNGTEPRELPYANEIDSRTGFNPRDNYWFVMGWPQVGFTYLGTEEPPPLAEEEMTFGPDTTEIGIAQQDTSRLTLESEFIFPATPHCVPMCYADPSDPDRNTMQLMGTLILGDRLGEPATFYARAAQL